MLVLSRKPGQRIVIDDDIIITVVELRQGRVVVGIDAPRDVNIAREEVAVNDTRGSDI
jgi:carbon storage regulator